LGSRYCHAKDVYEFLKEYKKIEYLFLLGDIFDGWCLKRKWYWDDTYNFIIRKILSLAKNGTKVIYVAGNHDEFIRPFINDFGSIHLVDEYVHTLASGKKALLIHGDQFDYITRHLKWLSLLGNLGYQFLLHSNKFVNFSRKICGCKSYWSFSNFAKQQVKRAANYINDFENIVTINAAKKNCNTIICGHIHTPKWLKLNNVEYWNCGDWVENNSVIIEDTNGKLMLFLNQHSYKV